MLPDTGAGGDIASGRVPVNVCDTVVIRSSNELKVGSQVLVLLVLFTLIVEVVEVKIVTLL